MHTLLTIPTTSRTHCCLPRYRREVGRRPRHAKAPSIPRPDPGRTLPHSPFHLKASIPPKSVKRHCLAVPCPAELSLCTTVILALFCPGVLHHWQHGFTGDMQHAPFPGHHVGSHDSPSFIPDRNNNLTLRMLSLEPFKCLRHVFHGKDLIIDRTDFPFLQPLPNLV